MRLIEIENVIRVIDRYISDDDTNLNIKLAITNIPTVDAEPVRHGHWIEDIMPVTGAVQMKCSNCGQAIYVAFNRKFNYCSHCGAKMDGERREDAETN